MTDDRDDTYTRLELEAIEAAGDIDASRPGTPEVAAFDREMTADLDEYNREIVARDGPDAPTGDRLLRQAGLLAERDPNTVAAGLAGYRARLGLDHAGLVAWLGITPPQLAALGLCARPVPTSPAFVDVVGGLARRYGADPGRLAEARGNPVSAKGRNKQDLNAGHPNWPFGPPPGDAFRRDYLRLAQNTRHNR